MTVLIIHGPVARLDLPSTDGRLLAADGLTLPSRAVPLLALHAGIDPRLGHYGAEPAGVISAWDVIDGVLEIVGDVYDDQRIPAGTYTCGLDTDRVETERRDSEEHEGGLLVVTAWRPIGVTLHLPGSLHTNAWPDLPPLVVEARS